MSPSTLTEVGNESEVKWACCIEPRKAEEAGANPSPQRRGRAEEPAFRSAILEWNHMTRSSRTLDFLLALFVNSSILLAPVFAGLYFTDTINLKQVETTFLIAPPPPPPPAAPPAIVAKAAVVHRAFEHAGKLIAPIAVPQHVADIKEAPIPDVDLSDGIPGGVAGGSVGGVIGGVIGGVTAAGSAAPIVPKEVKPTAPIRVGGKILPPKLILQVQPEYPSIARQVHLQGVVTIDAILDEKGNVEEMKVVSGPPLLYRAALDALGKWKYEPTYLNGQPVAVELLVTVTFHLNEH